MQEQPYSDAVLMQLLKDGHEDAFNRLYDRYWDKLFVVACHTLGSSAEAEEAVHDVFLKIWRQRASIVIQQSVSAYLAAAVKYEVISRLRKSYRREQLLANMPVIPVIADDPVTEQLREKELLRELEQGVQQLPEKCRIVFRMSRQQGYSAPEIAAELNVSIHTVESHLSKALRLLRKRFQRLFLYIMFINM